MPDVSRRGLLVAVAVLTVTAAVAVALVQLRAATLAAQAEERDEARVVFDRDLATLRTSLADPAHAAEAAADALRASLAELVIGSEGDPDGVRNDVNAHLARLRAAADDLEAAAQQPPPTRPDVLPVAEIDPVFDRITALEEQALALAGDLRAAADASRDYGDAAYELATAAATFAASVDELPDSDDPELLAEAWREELDRLAPYRKATDLAAGVEGLEALADVHRDLIEALTELAEGAVEDLEADDVDGYNDRLEDGLAGHDGDTVVEALAGAASDALEAGAVVQLQAGRERALGLLAELETLERKPADPEV